jgi:hypothetical protein
VWMDIFPRTVDLEIVSHLVKTMDHVIMVTVLVNLVSLGCIAKESWKFVAHTKI